MNNPITITPTQVQLIEKCLQEFGTIIELTEVTPNDQDLGEKLRAIIQPYIILKQNIQKQLHHEG